VLLFIARHYWWLSDMTIYLFFFLLVWPAGPHTPARALHSLHLGNTGAVLFDTSSATHVYISPILFFASSGRLLKEVVLLSHSLMSPTASSLFPTLMTTALPKSSPPSALVVPTLLLLRATRSSFPAFRGALRGW